jgi:hypothetical protein
MKATVIVALSILTLACESTPRESPDLVVWRGSIVETRTGAPIPDCLVRVYSETGRIVLDGRSNLIGEGRSGADGSVEIRFQNDSSPSHWVFDAKGYAPRSETAELDLDPVVRLERGSVFEGRVVDVLGRPVPGARISLFKGCGHAPAVRRAVADGEGRFRFDRVTVDRIWLEGEGIASSYAEWFHGPDGEVWVIGRPGFAVEGRVVDPRGRPIEGIWVKVWRRGPFARTDATGRFRLTGVEDGLRIGIATDTRPTANGVVTMWSILDAHCDATPVRITFDPETEDTDVTGGDPPDRPAVERPLLALRLADLPDPGFLGEFGNAAWIWTAEGERIAVGGPDEPSRVPPGVPMALHVLSDSVLLAVVPITIPAGTTGRVEKTIHLDLPPTYRFGLYRGRAPEVWVRTSARAPFHPVRTWRRHGRYEFVVPGGSAHQIYVFDTDLELGALVKPEEGAFDLGVLELSTRWRVRGEYLSGIEFPPGPVPVDAAQR